MATSNRRYRTGSRGGGNSTSWIAIGMLVVIVAAVFGIFLMMKKPVDETSSPTSTEKAGADPFADLPPDVPKGYTAPAAATAGGEKAPGTSPFADMVPPDEDPIWHEALVHAHRGQDLLDEATEARDAGDAATARSKGAEAQKEFEQALDITRDWAIEVGKKYGPDSKFTKLVDRRTGQWLEKVQALRHSAGM